MGLGLIPRDGSQQTFLNRNIVATFVSLKARITLRIPPSMAWGCAFIPMLVLIDKALNDRLTANPVEYLSQFTGWWALFFLMITLCVTPVRKFFNWPKLFPLRRVFGLISFIYAVVHVCVWSVFDHMFNLATIFADLIDRGFILLGMTSFLGLSVLAATSFTTVRRRISPDSWRKIHVLVYPIAFVVILHFYILTKLDKSEPIIFLLLFVVLIGLRMLIRHQEKHRLHYQASGFRRE